MLFPASAWYRLFFGVLIFAGVISCASPASQQKSETTPAMKGLVQLQPADSGPERISSDSPGLKGLSLTQGEFKLKAPRKKGPRFTLSARDVDVRSILMAIGKEVPQNIIIDPDVSARITVDLKDVTLGEALDSILYPSRLTYEIDRRNIRIRPERLQTRIFHLNYIISSRRGSSNLSSSSGSTSSGSSTSSSSGASSSRGTGRSTSSIFTSEEADLWTEIGAGLQLIVCQEDEVSSSSGTSGTGGTGGGSSSSTLGCTASSNTETSAAAIPASTEGGAETVAPAPSATATSSDQPYFVMNKQSGVIIVRAYPNTMIQVAGFLEAVEGSAQRQVFIEAKIIEVTLNDAYKLGIDWSVVSPLTIDNGNPSNFDFRNTTLTGAANFAMGLGNFNFNIVLDALALQGSVSVLSSPKIATLNNQRAVIKVGTEDVFFTPQITAATTTSGATTEFIPTTITIGIVLDVLPQINANGHIMMSINTSITEKTGERTSPDGINVVPILSVREANNVVLARSGQTIVIGGLMKTKKEKKQNALPFFSAIPIIGNLFTHESETTEKTELIIMLTPTIMAGLEIDDRYNFANKRLSQMGITPPPPSQSMNPPIRRY